MRLSLVPPPEVLVARLHVRADLRAVERMPRGPERRRAAYEALTSTAMATQRDAVTALGPLRAQGIVTSIRSLFLPNALLVAVQRGGEQAVRDALEGVAAVADVRRSERFAVSTPARAAEPVAPGPPGSWAMDLVRAPAAWRRGATGHGVTIGFVDSGLDTAHPAIAPIYRGTQSDGRQLHDHNWLDPFQRRSVPYDLGGHGTTTASVAAAAQIGAAPQARVVMARGSDHGQNTHAATLEALQWMLAPTKVDGSDPRPELGVDVLNNSWGTADGRDEFFRESYDGLRAAGIEVITATGNAGPEPGSVSAPASYAGFIAVGATDRHGELAEFSSRGPSPLDHPVGVFAPTVIAPGTVVPTAKAGAGYVFSSGTSVAAPIVAGAVADLLSVVPQATHGQLVEALTKTAVDVAAPGPDENSGFGRIDIAAAAEYLRSHVGAPTRV